MTVDRSYRDSALSTRRAARAHLQELRAARRARRGASLRVQTEETPSSDGQFAVGADLLFASPPPEEACGQTAEVTPMEEGSTSPADDPSPEPATDMAPMAPPPAEPEPVLDTTPPEEAPSETAQENIFAELSPPDTTPPPPDQAHHEPACTPLQSDIVSDLSTLPGAGDGMIWLFHQCGAKSLADLAKADAPALSQRLGVVGYILDIRPWIEFARNKETP